MALEVRVGHFRKYPVSWKCVPQQRHALPALSKAAEVSHVTPATASNVEVRRQEMLSSFLTFNWINQERTRTVPVMPLPVLPVRGYRTVAVAYCTGTVSYVASTLGCLPLYTYKFSLLSQLMVSL
jgi:hypothetical protein